MKDPLEAIATPDICKQKGSTQKVNLFIYNLFMNCQCVVSGKNLLIKRVVNSHNLLKFYVEIV